MVDWFLVSIVLCSFCCGCWSINFLHLQNLLEQVTGRSSRILHGCSRRCNSSVRLMLTCYGNTRIFLLIISCALHPGLLLPAVSTRVVSFFGILRYFLPLDHALPKRAKFGCLRLRGARARWFVRALPVLLLLLGIIGASRFLSSSSFLLLGPGADGGAAAYVVPSLVPLPCLSSSSPPSLRAIRAAGAAERPVLMRHRRHRSAGAALPAVAGEYRARRVAITRVTPNPAC